MTAIVPSVTDIVKSNHNIEIQVLKKIKPEYTNFYSYIAEKIKYDNTGKCINPFELISDLNVLLLAYNSIKSNPGNMTEGIDEITLDGVDSK